MVHVDNHLGLESWFVRLVYRHTHQIILASIKKPPNDPNNIDVNIQQPNPPHPFNHTLVKYLNCALLINPDVTTFWNARRRLLQKDRLDIGREFKFSAIVLSKKPKSNDAFCYRRWLYSFQSHESIDWTRELSLTERCSSKSLSNYQAWQHRQWVLQKANNNYLLKYEFATTERFIRKHIGDYSSYCHRQFVLYKMNELHYFEYDPNAESNLQQYSALIRYLKSHGLIDGSLADDLNEITQQQNDAYEPAWKTLMKIIVPQRDYDINISDNDKIRIKTFLYCMNVAAYDLKFVDELKEMFGYREAFECHRRAIVEFMADKSIEWSITSTITNAIMSILQSISKHKPFVAVQY